MTTERAIEILTPDRKPDYSPAEYEEALTMAREALRKKTKRVRGNDDKTNADPRG